MSKGKAEFMLYIIVVFAIAALIVITYMHASSNDDKDTVTSEMTELLKQYREGIHLKFYVETAAQQAACKATFNNLQSALASDSCKKEGIPLLQNSGECMFNKDEVNKKIIPAFKKEFEKLLLPPYIYPKFKISSSDNIEGKFSSPIVIQGEHSYSIKPDFSVGYPAELEKIEIMLNELSSEHTCIDYYNPISTSTIEEECKLVDDAEYEKKGDYLLITLPVKLSNCADDSVTVKFLYSSSP